MTQHYVRFQVDVPVNSEAQANELITLKSNACAMIIDGEHLSWIVDENGEPVAAVPPAADPV
jgi:hypothetical protein